MDSELNNPVHSQITEVNLPFISTENLKRIKYRRESRRRKCFIP